MGTFQVLPCLYPSSYTRRSPLFQYKHNSTLECVITNKTSSNILKSSLSLGEHCCNQVSSCRKSNLYFLNSSIIYSKKSIWPLCPLEVSIVKGIWRVYVGECVREKRRVCMREWESVGERLCIRVRESVYVFCVWEGYQPLFSLVTIFKSFVGNMIDRLSQVL